MTTAELARRAPFILAAVVGAGAILGCALLAGTVAYLTQPAETYRSPVPNEGNP